MAGTQDFYRFRAAMEKYRKNTNEAKKNKRRSLIYNSEIGSGDIVIQLFGDNARS